MKCAVFGKKKTANKKDWIEYSTHLKKKTGEEEYFRVKFSPIEIAPKVNECPINISFVPGIDANKGDPEVFTTSDGVEVKIPVIWINRYDVGEPWVDHSLDEYVDD